MLLRPVEIKYKPEDDKRISISILSPFVVLIIQSFILYYLNLLDTTIGNLVQMASKALVGLFFIYSFPTVMKRSFALLILTYSVSIFIFLLNYLFFIQNTTFLNDILFMYFFVCLPCLIYSFSINDKVILYKVMKKLSIIIFIIGLTIGGLVLTNKMDIGIYNMSIGYYLLLPAIVFLNNFIDKASIKSGVLAIVSILIILSIGSRGPILCIAIYFILYQIINFKKLNKRKFIFNILITIIILLVILYLEEILIMLARVLASYGINSRSISLFMQDKVRLSGRELIYRDVLHQIRENPIFGVGIAGDRLYTGTYSHNILIELISSFGVVIGCLIIVSLFIIILKSLFSLDIEGANSILIWLAIGFIPLFVSSTYLTYFQFWIFLGLALRFTGKKTQQKLKKTYSKYNEVIYEKDSSTVNVIGNSFKSDRVY
jgi:O-antigen ligase